ncbi:MAG TPA: deoxyguanosinetriphosphate triphosphohydrolase [Geminicoccaceae bacterium]|nr:deoxyguanosinetriphosphate triphosphohydrolase [Geminicoccaceae bacterium]
MSNRRLGFDARPGRALAPYACDPERSRGRRHLEPEDPLRSPFQRDRDRIVHSTAFRRLEHKTQVFVSHEGDHFRTRLTHTLEVAQIARAAARALGLDEDLAEAVALAHDLGHSPFGHAGEDALDALLEAHGGFDHNAQTLRVITHLERRYAEFDGLNLTWETLEGVVKHNGPQTDKVPPYVASYCAGHDLEPATYPSAEAQIAALADDIAYANHDLDDGLRAGLFEIADLADLPLVGPTFASVAGRYPGIEQPRLIHETLRRLINLMVVDLVEETERRLASLRPADAAAIRGHDRPVVGFSPEVGHALQKLRRFLYSRMYSHYKVKRMQRKARQVVQELFAGLLAQPDCLPPDWQARAGAPGDARTAEAIRDYIAGMTDRFALDEHDRMFHMTDRSR